MERKGKTETKEKIKNSKTGHPWKFSKVSAADDTTFGFCWSGVIFSEQRVASDGFFERKWLQQEISWTSNWGWWWLRHLVDTEDARRRWSFSPVSTMPAVARCSPWSGRISFGTAAATSSCGITVPRQVPVGESEDRWRRTRQRRHFYSQGLVDWNNDRPSNNKVSFPQRNFDQETRKMTEL